MKGPGPDRAVVFQNYGLFEWMTVWDNVAFGLKACRVPKAARRQIVQDHLELVHLSAFGHCYPYELSGGMQQRLSFGTSSARILDVS